MDRWYTSRDDPAPAPRPDGGAASLDPDRGEPGRRHGKLQDRYRGTLRISAAMPRKLFVTTALPYANAPFHIGHMMEYIQADIWVRFMRMRGHSVAFVGADDAHGAPIMIAAEKAGKTPQQFVAEIAADRQRYLDGYHPRVRPLAHDRLGRERRAVAGDLSGLEGERPDHDP